MHTYNSGRHTDRELRYAGTREWVFPLLGKRSTRDRVNLISGLELKRRPDCEPTLRALVTDDWSPETIHHVGWCESCRTAGFALGAGAFAGGRAAPAPNRGRAVLVAVIVAAAIAVPAIASQVVDNPFGSGQTAVRGGIAVVVHKPIVPRSHTHKPKPSTTGTPGTTGKPSTTGTTGTSGNAGSGSDHGGKAGGTSGTTTPKPPTKIIPKPRTKPLGATIPAHHAATIVPQMRIHAELPHTT